jgi:hypothetical protein
MTANEPATPELYEASVVNVASSTLAIVRAGREKRLSVRGNAAGFGGPADSAGDARLFALTAENAAELRRRLPNLQPALLGLRTSAGTGDRLGLATSGHVRAFQRAGAGLAPIFAQQSIREMARTGRSPADVLTDATWGAFQAGWRGPVGADADHLKTPDDIDATAAAGFSFYTIDPGEHVDSAADTAGASSLAARLDALPWDVLESSPADLQTRYGGRTFDLGERALPVSPEQVARAAAKYGGAVAHVVRMYRHLASKGIPFELEVSVDETETPTTHAEHYYVAAELRRLGVRWVSLAPRFVGRFEKGVDYIGDLEALRTDLAGHAQVARALGPYKLSLHSGSDKFSVYPLIVEAARGLVHLKTAGTSYLEALRVVANVDAGFFREILALARERYPVDRASYHVSAHVERVPPPETLADGELPALLDGEASIDAREVLHVTFGSVLGRWDERLKALLRANEEAYDTALEQHFTRHLTLFSGAASSLFR